MEKTSLDDFVGATGGDESLGDAEPSDDDGSAATSKGAVSDPMLSTKREGDVDSSEDGPERPTVTARWTDDAEPCAECGEPSQWRWAQTGALVCQSCKEW